MAADKGVQELLSTCNGEKHLRNQLDSIFGQTIADRICVLVRDDGSTDGTRDILRSYEGRPGFQVEYAGNIGITGSYMWLLERSDPECTYVATCDQDDVWLPEKLETAVQALSAGDGRRPRLFTSVSELVDDSLNHLGYSATSEAHISFHNAMVENVCPGHTYVLNRSLVEAVLRSKGATNVLVMDWWIYLIAAGLCEVVFSTEAFVRHRQHARNAVGYDTSLWGALVSQFYRLRTGTQSAVSRQLAAFSHYYEEEIPAQYRKELPGFLGALPFIGSRIRYLTDGKVYRQSKSKTHIMKFMYLLGVLKSGNEQNDTHSGGMSGSDTFGSGWCFGATSVQKWNRL